MKYFALLIVLTHAGALAVDFSSTTLRDFDAKPKSQLLAVGANVSRNVRAELDVGLTTTPTNGDFKSTVGAGLSYRLWHDDKWEVNSKTGINYQQYIIDSSSNYYGVVGFEVIRHLSDNKYFVFEVTQKLQPTDYQSIQTGAGMRVITGVRYKF